jgi:glycerophosphoryl diester phosphodiesterase
MRQLLLILTGIFLLSSTFFAQEPPRRELLGIAHRGASAYAPENTIASFKKAIELRADALEVDIRQTKDHHLVALHDATVDRTTNGGGGCV